MFLTLISHCGRLAQLGDFGNIHTRGKLIVLDILISHSHAGAESRCQPGKVPQNLARILLAGARSLLRMIPIWHLGRPRHPCQGVLLPVAELYRNESPYAYASASQGSSRYLRGLILAIFLSVKRVTFPFHMKRSGAAVTNRPDNN